MKGIRDVGTLRSLITGIEDWTEKDASHVLFHYCPEEPLQEERHFEPEESTMKIASKHVYRRVVDLLGKALRDEKRLFTTMLRCAVKFAVAVGWMYEAEVHERLTCQPNELQIRVFDKELTLGTSKSIPVPRLGRKYFISLSELAQNVELRSEARLLHIPTIPNQGGWDSFCLSLAKGYHLDVFQVTIARKHPVKCKYVKELCQSFLATKEAKKCKLKDWKDVKVRFIFVIPTDRLDDFRDVQDFERPDGQEM